MDVEIDKSTSSSNMASNAKRERVNSPDTGNIDIGALLKKEDLTSALENNDEINVEEELVENIIQLLDILSQVLSRFWGNIAQSWYMATSIIWQDDPDLQNYER
ncbi:hypothetical protein Bhyg_03110 [Pseudolycoriella hygida]|uniref:Uncharacterized protein n=1 Tax=Pseudolycoriella hygida TaxID=35572 RepID=A0A9Q0NDW6_9DIPT|nr:hypothetical protein Bhyg_03110 [Pseudolycoriella hygida]